MTESMPGRSSLDRAFSAKKGAMRRRSCVIALRLGRGPLTRRGSMCETPKEEESEVPGRRSSLPGFAGQSTPTCGTSGMT
jgi:hypothetical protein